MSDAAIAGRARYERTVLPYRAARAGFWWAPVMAGVVTAIALQMLFTVLGMAIGVSVIGPRDGADAGTMGTAAGVWWLITGTLSLLLGGMVLGRVWGRSINMPLHLHALCMWGVVTLFGFFVIWSGFGVVSETTSPMAAIAAQDETLRQNGIESLTPGGEIVPDSAEITEAARSAARSASWWSVIGLIIGIAASIGGAAIAAAASTLEDGEPASVG